MQKTDIFYSSLFFFFFSLKKTLVDTHQIDFENTGLALLVVFWPPTLCYQFMTWAGTT